MTEIRETTVHYNNRLVATVTHDCSKQLSLPVSEMRTRRKIYTSAERKLLVPYVIQACII